MERFSKITRWMLILCLALFWGGCALHFAFHQIAVDADGNPIRLERLKP